MSPHTSSALRPTRSRLARHALSEALADARPADVAAAICGVHAQILTAAELSLSVRLSGVTRAELQAALR